MDNRIKISVISWIGAGYNAYSAGVDMIIETSLDSFLKESLASLIPGSPSQITNVVDKMFDFGIG